MRYRSISKMKSSPVPPSCAASRFAAAAICSSCRASPGIVPGLSVRDEDVDDDLSVSSAVIDVAAELDVSADSCVLIAAVAVVVPLILPEDGVARSESPRLHPGVSSSSWFLGEDCLDVAADVVAAAGCCLESIWRRRLRADTIRSYMFHVFARRGDDKT